MLADGDQRSPFLLLAQNHWHHGVIGIVGSKSGEFAYAQRFTIVDTLSSRDCGYPSGVVLSNGRVMLLYYTAADAQHTDWARPHIAAAIFTPSMN